MSSQLRMSPAVWYAPDEKSPSGPIAVHDVNNESGEVVATLENRRGHRPSLWEYKLTKTGKRSKPVFPSAQAAVEAVAAELSS